jgi:hypothetical protein
MKLRFFFALAPLVLAACAPAAGIGGAAILAPIVASAVGISPAVLSDVALAGCAAQAAANAGAQLASASPAWVKRFAEASTLAGLACAW